MFAKPTNTIIEWRHHSPSFTANSPPISCWQPFFQQLNEITSAFCNSWVHFNTYKFHIFSISYLDLPTSPSDFSKVRHNFPRFFPASPRFLLKKTTIPIPIPHPHLWRRGKVKASVRCLRLEVESLGESAEGKDQERPGGETSPGGPWNMPLTLSHTNYIWIYM